MKFRFSILALLAFLAIPAISFAQGSCSPDKIALLDTGRPAGGASIRVCTSGSTGTPCTPAASLFTDPTLGTPLGGSPVVTADNHGNWGFCAAAGALYDYQVSCTGCTTLTVKNFPLPPSVPITAAALTSATANPANVGTVKLASVDCLDWRNNANSGNIQLCKSGAVSGNVPADTFDMTAAATRSQAFIDNSANPAASGVVRCGNNVTCVSARNQANSGDFGLIKLGVDNLTHLLGGGADFSIPAVTDQAVGRDTTDTITHKTVGVGGIAGVTLNKQVFTASGTFTIPAGITSVKVTLVGGGGAGGGATATFNGGGGGSGGAAIKWLTGLTPANTITVTVGAGGTGVSAAAGNSGTASSIASGTQTITTVTANPGGGGNANGAQSAGGAGGAISTNGDLNFGGNPGSGDWSTISGAAGGGSIFAGAGPDSNGGNPGVAAIANTGSGGGGAGAGANRAGGNGAAGIVIFEWVN